MAYELEGRLLEVCNCNILCPCWVGGDPDNGTCDAIAAWHIDRGVIDGVDVSGRTFAGLTHIPGNILKGNWRMVAIMDDQATPEQQEALLKVWTGKLGGPLADYAQLVGEVVAVERVPVAFELGGTSAHCYTQAHATISACVLNALSVQGLGTKDSELRF